MLRNLMPLRAAEGTDGPAAPKGPEQRETDAHTAGVSDRLNKATDRDESGLHVGDQPPTTERMLAGHDADAEAPTSDRATEDEIRELLTWDPYSDEEGEHPGSKKTAQAETPPEGGDKEVPQPGTTGEQAREADPQAQPAQSDELRQARADLAEAQRIIRELAQKQAQSQPAPVKKSKEDEEAAERQRLGGVYNWNIPDELAEALGSEDLNQRKGALANLFNSAARETHLNALKDVREVLEHFMQQLPQIVQGIVQNHSQQADLTQDLYGAHQDLNKPYIRRLVPEIAKTVLKETGATSWSAQLRDLVAQRVRQELGLQQPQTQVQPQAPAQPSNGTTQRPPAAFRSTVRSGGQGYASRQQEDIMRTFGL